MSCQKCRLLCPPPQLLLLMLVTNIKKYRHRRFFPVRHCHGLSLILLTSKLLIWSVRLCLIILYISNLHYLGIMYEVGINKKSSTSSMRLG
ncbi:hypothetical protein F4811DRAFT_263259 [Daldinia bambusicola]|nr:hypothetical protein F4811DRAFT_263259 [Daldinia bambusicola]